ncbi:MAG: phosphoribosylaminoimidazole synthetase [Candidatus Methanolliviera sp. GoM_oil]|nr:MAG: phosphoribosylaminoimidazole synthetase [Candidatus Methanolliviera sp. GoM_oil]
MLYKDAGVDIEKEGELIKSLISRIKPVRKGFGRPLGKIGHFSGLVDFGGFALAMTTDGVGTKILVANRLKKWDTIGIDCIAMNVNDLLAIGAEPIAFVDYLAIGEMKEKYEVVVGEIGEGLNDGARISNISIVGGETATLPEIITGIDLAGTCVGVVKKEEMIDGKKISPGDSVLAIRSSGIHSNGLTLARKIIDSSNYDYDDLLPGGDVTIGEELIKPTRIYMEVLELVKEHEIHGLAHITGGGLLNLKRITNYGFNIYNPPKPQPIFEFLRELGGVSYKEMYRTFNMGAGFIIVAPKEEEKNILEKIDGEKIGEVTEKAGIKINLGDKEIKL